MKQTLKQKSNLELGLFVGEKGVNPKINNK